MPDTGFFHPPVPPWLETALSELAHRTRKIVTVRVADYGMRIGICYRPPGTLQGSSRQAVVVRPQQLIERRLFEELVKQVRWLWNNEPHTSFSEVLQDREFWTYDTLEELIEERKRG